MRRHENRARITAQLIEVRGQTHLWAESYDRELADIIALQNEVVCRIARSLALELLPERRLNPARARSVNPAAYEAYFRGRFSWYQRTETGLKSAISYFEEALQHDPKLASAYVGIADSAILLPWFGAMTPSEAAGKTVTAARRALEIDSNLGDAHGALALLHFWFSWDWEEAEQEFLRSLELNPNNATVHSWYSAYLVSMARFEEAARQQRLAAELDPLSLIIANAAGQVFFYSGRYDDAVEAFQSVLAREPAFLPAHFNLGQVYLQKKLYREAIASFENTLQWSKNAGACAALARALASAGNKTKARELLAELLKPCPGTYIASPLVALVHFALGDHDAGFEWMDKGFGERSYWMTFLKVDPAYDQLRHLPRFKRLMQRLQFEPAISRLAA